MSEFRQNIATGEWVIIAKERGKRPEDFKDDNPDVRKNLPEHADNCPFCKGGVAEGDESIYQIKDEKGWKLRIIPNKFAAVRKIENPDREQEGLYIKAPGYGIADVVIESPQHNATIATMDLSTIEEILKAYKFRHNELIKDKNVTVVNIFRNNGAKAGASQIHPHSQIIGTLVTPPHVTDQIYYARRSYHTWGKCVYCAMLKEELKQKTRIVFESDHFVAFCPYASRSPFETRILPKKHSSVFGNIESDAIKDLAMVLKTILGKMYNFLNDPDYNYIIRSITSDDGEVQFYHWYIVLIPKITKTAGFEIGSGMYINSTDPESCAASLREA